MMPRNEEGSRTTRIGAWVPCADYSRERERERERERQAEKHQSTNIPKREKRMVRMHE